MWIVNLALRRPYTFIVLAIFILISGGLAILRAIERADYDVFRHRPALGKLDYLRLGWRALRGRLET